MFLKKKRFRHLATQSPCEFIIIVCAVNFGNCVIGEHGLRMLIDAMLTPDT